MKFQSPSNPLYSLTVALTKFNESLGKDRNVYLSLEAEKDYKRAMMIKAAPGKSNAEKVVNAHASEEWLEFHKKLGRAKAVYDFQKLKFSVMEKEWLAQHLEMKLEGSLMKKEIS